jgi:hypothetical protein
MNQTTRVFAFIFAAILIHVMCSYAVVYFGEQFYRDRFEKCPRPKVFDLTHKVLPNLSNHKVLHGLYDVIAAMLLVSPLVLNMTVFYLYWFLLVAIRGLTNLVTILPKDKDCNPADYAGLKQLFLGHCYDKIYSGHFATATLFGILLHQAYPKQVSLWMVISALVLYALLILATRAHYTIDLVVSVFAVLAVLHIRFTAK